MAGYNPFTNDMKEYKFIMGVGGEDICDKDVCQFCGEDDHKTRGNKKCPGHFNYNVGKILDLKSKVDSYEEEKEYNDAQIETLVEIIGFDSNNPIYKNGMACFSLLKYEIYKMKRRIIELENNNKELEEKNKRLFQLSQIEIEQDETILASDLVGLALRRTPSLI